MAKQNLTAPPIVDEEFMKEMISQGLPMKRPVRVERPVEENESPAVMETPVTEEKYKEPVRRKKGTVTDYKEAFLVRNNLKDRECVYISNTLLETISQIVGVMKRKELTSGIYIENILRHHFETYKDDINKLYAELVKPPLP